ncbi:hypothetical protein BST81_05805 [Leptolyngbya sp. 'hensonii']|nr:hypothetical protein BST81_05805 [Leptolyngbya sp. 'hensonii']
MSRGVVSPRFPRAKLWRRAIALGLDVGLTWFISLLCGEPGSVSQSWCFLLVWMTLRVLVVVGLHGQSPGRWCGDIKLLELERGRTPKYEVLLARELMIGLLLLLSILGITDAIRNQTHSSLLLLLPLLVDSGAVLIQPRRHALHDRLMKTMVVPTRRGLALGFRLNSLVAKMNSYMRR